MENTPTQKRGGDDRKKEGKAAESRLTGGGIGGLRGERKVETSARTDRRF